MADASIKAYFGGDTTQLQAAITQAHAMTNKFAKDSANVFQEVGRAETSLAAFRKQADLERGAGFQQHIILQREMREINAQINAIEGQTVQKLELQLQLDQKILSLEKMIAQEARQSASVGGGTRAAATGAAQAAAQTTIWGKSLNKVIGLGPALKGLFAGLGIASVSMAVEKIVDHFRKAAEAAQELESLTGRVADANIEAMRSRLSAEDKLTLVTQDRERLELRIANNASKTDEDRTRSLNDQLLLSLAIKEEVALRAKVEGEAEKKREAFLDHYRKIEEKISKAREEAQKAEVKRQGEIADAVDKALTRTDTVNRRLFQQKLQSATLDERLVLLEEEKAKIVATQNQYAKNTTGWKEQQVEINDINKTIEQTRLEIAEKTAAAEANITKNKEKQTRIGFETATQSIFSDTSDATLREIVRRERERVLSIAANTGNITEIISRAGSQQRLAAAQSELDVRKKTLYNASVGGEERARQLFKGDPMEFDKFYSQLTAGVNKDDKIIETLEKTNNLLAGKFRNQ